MSLYKIVSVISNKWNIHTLLVQMQNGTVLLENSVAGSYEVKHTI